MLNQTLRSSLLSIGCVLAYLSCAPPSFAQTEQVDAALIKDNAAFVIFRAAPHCSYTVPTSINMFLAVTGSCSADGPGGVMNGFVRDPLGNVTIFNPEGGTDTRPTGINAQGFITAAISIPSGKPRGFLRAPDGTVTNSMPMRQDCDLASGHERERGHYAQLPFRKCRPARLRAVVRRNHYFPQLWRLAHRSLWQQ